MNPRNDEPRKPEKRRDRCPPASEDELWPGELPFTAWGQHEVGVLDLRVLDQTEWWVDINQRPHRLDDMSAIYIANVIRMLEENAHRYYVDTLRRHTIQVLGDALLDKTYTVLAADVHRLVSAQALSPADWLERTPLMRALRMRGQ